MSEKCPKTEHETDQNILAVPPKEECCDTRTVKQIPDELREPSSTYEPEEEYLNLPTGILLSSHGKEAHCTGQGQWGEIIRVQEKYLQQTVYFSAVLSISDEALDYIARHRLEPKIEEQFHNNELTVEGLARMTGMTRASAEEFIQVLNTTQSQLDKNAQLVAESKLKCYYSSTSQTARCEDDEMLRPGDYPGAVFEVTTPAGEYTSEYSQEDADNKALYAAQSLLECYYGNDTFTTTCEERGARPQDVMDPVPNDTSEVYPGRGLRRGSVTVPANRFVSRTSKDDANSKASSWGEAQLSCWYTNNPVEKSCDDPDARNEYVDPLTSPPAEADIEKGISGQHVVIPFGYIKSELSPELATEEALLLADTLLKCCFINDEYSVSCQTEEVTLGTDEIQDIEPDKTIPEWTTSVPRGKFTSCHSKEEANMLAQQYVEGVLICQYCSVEVLPTCVPDWVIEGIKNKTIDLPLNGPIITDGVHYTSVHSLSPDATRGAPAGMVCLTGAQQAQLLAESSAAVALSGEGSWCTCYSEEVIVGCSVEDPYGNNLSSGERGVSPTGEPYTFISIVPPGWKLSEMHTYPVPGEYLRFAAGIYTENCAGEIDQTNGATSTTEWVKELAVSLVHCAYANPPLEGQCGLPKVTTTGDADAEVWRFGLGKSESSYLTPWSPSASHPLQLPEGIIHQEITSDSPEEYAAVVASVYAQSQDLVQSMLVCSYYNERRQASCMPQAPRYFTYGTEEAPSIKSECVTEERSATEGLVPANTIIADTPAIANEIAQDMAQGMAACDIDTTCTYQYFEPDIEDPQFPVSSSSSSSNEVEEECTEPDFEIELGMCGFPVDVDDDLKAILKVVIDFEMCGDTLWDCMYHAVANCSDSEQGARGSYPIAFAIAIKKVTCDGEEIKGEFEVSYGDENTGCDITDSCSCCQEQAEQQGFKHTINVRDTGDGKGIKPRWFMCGTKLKVKVKSAQGSKGKKVGLTKNIRLPVCQYSRVRSIPGDPAELSSSGCSYLECPHYLDRSCFTSRRQSVVRSIWKNYNLALAQFEDGKLEYEDQRTKLQKKINVVKERMEKLTKLLERMK